ncbi:MAG: hypothetical protein ACTSVV_03955 [Promethearchaeota archaeon]
MIEVKDSYLKPDEQKFIIKESTSETILHWQDLWIDEEKLKEYLKENPFPKDKYYSKKEFLQDLECEGYVSISVNKKETAEFIAELFYKLI